MAFKYILLACVVASVSLAQSGGRTSPSFDLNFSLDNDLEEEAPVIPILRFLDTQNPDGSYTYGYESGDGTYKFETRYVTGEVKGKYGYYDPTGMLRETTYGAAPNRGFEPVIEGLVVAGPTIHDESDEKVFGPVQRAANPASNFQNFAPTEERSSRRVVKRKRPTQARGEIPRRPVEFRAEVPQQRAVPAFRPQAASRFAPIQVAADPNAFFGHPAQNINLLDGSYTVNYSG
jgi:hypothetical protein